MLGAAWMSTMVLDSVAVAVVGGVAHGGNARTRVLNPRYLVLRDDQLPRCARLRRYWVCHAAQMLI